MRTHVDRAHDADAGPALVPSHVAARIGTVRSAGWGPVAMTPDAWRSSPVLPARVVAHLAATVGNRATCRVVAQRLAVQRYIAPPEAKAIAAQLEEAMSGLGTDEEAIYGALAGRRAEDVQGISRAYQDTYKKDLVAELRDELTEDEFERIRPSLEAREEGTMSAGECQSEAMNRAGEIAQQLHDAMEGAGTEEDQIYNVLTGRTPTEIEEIASQYAIKFGRPLETDLRDDLSGDELGRALELIGRADTGTVRSREREQLVEGIDATVQGEFNYALTDDRLEIRVPVHFAPPPGTKLSTWNSQIDSVWNQFAIAAPGGRRVAIHMTLVDEADAARRVEVVPNQVANQVGPNDRADAGHFYETMSADTAPHEFGHLLGLADEYQRTAADIQVVTGEQARTGASNTSAGLTAEDIAREINRAIAEPVPAKRTRLVTNALRGAGLIDLGVPQQGDFAQAVLRAYDAAYGGSGGTGLIATLRTMPDNWTATSVFSFASGTLMGVGGAYGLQPHEHPVMPRHLQVFRSIVANRWPDLEWEIE